MATERPDSPDRMDPRVEALVMFAVGGLLALGLVGLVVVVLV